MKRLEADAARMQAASVARLLDAPAQGFGDAFSARRLRVTLSLAQSIRLQIGAEYDGATKKTLGERGGGRAKTEVPPNDWPARATRVTSPPKEAMLFCTHRKAAI